MKAFHGTTYEFDKFRIEPLSAHRLIDGELTRVTPSAFFFTQDLETAWLFALSRHRLQGGQPQIVTVELSVESTLDLTISDWNEVLREYPNFCNPQGINPVALDRAQFAFQNYSIDTWDDIHIALDDPMVIAELQDMGYDSVRIYESNYGGSICVFNSGHIEITGRESGRKSISQKIKEAIKA